MTDTAPAPQLTLTFKPLWKTLIDKGMRKQDLRERAGLSASTIAKLGRDGNVTIAMLLRICQALDCGLPDVVEVRPLEAHPAEVQS